MIASFKQIGDTFIAFGNSMATKDDISRLETDISSIKATQEQILKLLQQSPGGEK